jgi:hypothetical protein
MIIEHFINEKKEKTVKTCGIYFAHQGGRILMASLKEKKKKSYKLHALSITAN